MFRLVAFGFTAATKQTTNGKNIVQLIVGGKCDTNTQCSATALFFFFLLLKIHCDAGVKISFMYVIQKRVT